MDTTYGINDHNAWNPKWDDSNGTVVNYVPSSCSKQS